MGVGLAAGGGPYVITPPLLRHSSIHKQNPTGGDPPEPHHIHVWRGPLLLTQVRNHSSASI